VFSSADGAGKLHLWLAPLDRRSPPHQIPGVEGENPAFGPAGEILFRKIEGASAFIYAVREDGTALRKAADLPVLNVLGRHPDRKWLLIGALGQGMVILPTGGGTPLPTQLSPKDLLKWTGDGKHLFVCSTATTRPRTRIVPLATGQVVPRGIEFARDVPLDPQLEKLPGVRIIPIGDTEPGPTADIYAFTRETVQRNLYRIPVP
jgi:hypothetical protein